MNASVFLPFVAANVPKIIAIIELISDANSPICILVVIPFTVLASISLPSQSVPNGCAKLGASPLFAKSTAYALSSIAIPMQSTPRITIVPIIISANVLVRRLNIFDSFRVTLFSILSLLYSRINDRIQ